jgi:acyl dehydratase
MMKEGQHYEDFEVGKKYVTLGRTITETDILNYVALTGTYEQLFMNLEYIEKESVFKRRIAPGVLTFAYAEGLVVQSGLLHGTGLALLGIELGIKAPVFCNDTIHVEIEVTEKRLTKDPSRGIVTTVNKVINQNGETVLEYIPKRMIKVRNPL